ncbi:MAG: pyridoxal phosphate-dependent aminotransferase family protein [Acidobacteria bacterium]|nr:pyridoxal phosphate-dependent aminotransferase family protein [Acidobacteriota bacterium]
MSDFTSALYLGLAHEHASLRPWQQFTSGKPAVLKTMPGALSLASDLALLTGCEAATIAPSTLHLFLDVFSLWPHARTTSIYMDEGLYQIGRWGVERAMAHGLCVRRFRHQDPNSLARCLLSGNTRNAIVVTDGFCPGCGKPAPVREYLDCLAGCKGWLVIDDTQAIGVLGRNPSAPAPLGLGGGGIMSMFNLRDSRAVLVCSLAKGFGVPMAFLAGARPLVDRFELASETRVHCSPVAAPVLHAAEQALAFNEHAGDRARAALAQLILRLQSKLKSSRFRPGGGMFPVQTFTGFQDLPAEEIHRRLAASGIQTVLQRRRTSGEPQVAILLTARHTTREIDKLSSTILALEDHCHGRPNLQFRSGRVRTSRP